MTKDLNRFKKIHKNTYKIYQKKLQNKELENNWIEYVFPLIHGFQNRDNKNYRFYNIVEAREFLNDKTLYKNIIEISKLLLNFNTNNILDILNKEDSLKLKSSLTLFDYVTNPNINSLLIFRNYDKKLIKKVFTEKKEFTIFKKILDKFYDGEIDNETILLIESEIFEYSQKNITLKNIDENNLNAAENLLIKYSEICPIAMSGQNKSNKKNITKKFLKELTEEESILFLKFNISEEVLKEGKKQKYKIKEKIIAFSILGILLLSGRTIISFKESLSYNTILVSTIAKQTLMKLEEQNISKNSETEIEQENNTETSSDITPVNPEPAPAPVIQEQPKPVIREYPYVTPSGTGNEALVQIALSQVGNVGGEIYWRWYGFNSRVPWCAIFTSWVASQAGISTNVIPRFSRVVDGVSWFTRNQLFRNREYIPRTGDLIFFDYDLNGVSDHVGIVNRVANGRVYTVEGNSKNDTCLEQSYTIGHKTIYGYGTPNY